MLIFQVVMLTLHMHGGETILDSDLANQFRKETFIQLLEGAATHQNGRGTSLIFQVIALGGHGTTITIEGILTPNPEDEASRLI